jgi:ATP phosphoribosyltransferase/sugar/nucleoside kinase (ribokinase family)
MPEDAGAFSIPVDAIVGLGCTTRDRIVIAPRDELDAFLAAFPSSTGVTIGMPEAARQAYRRFAASAGCHRWSPGGTVPNTLCAVSAGLLAMSSRIPVLWKGPAEYGDSVSVEPALSHLREWGVGVEPAFSTDVVREAFCLVDEATRSVRHISIFERAAHVEAGASWQPSRVLLMTVHDLLHADTALRAHAIGCEQLVLLIADWRPTPGTAPFRSLLADFPNITFLFGRRRDFRELGLWQEDGLSDPLLAGVECVGTDGPGAVLWKGAARMVLEKLPVAAMHDIHGNDLGAGDGYAGAFLASRLAGAAPSDAHEFASRHARAVLQVPVSYLPRSRDLNEVFPAHIDRRSARADEGRFRERLHASPGLVITSCGQTGIDQLSGQVARQLGITAFAIMPAGRRTETSDAHSGDPDRLDNITVLELATPSYRFCTWANVFASDGTILLDYAGSEGSEETRKAASWLRRPLLELAHVPARDVAARVTDWVDHHGLRVLNCAGNRKSLLGEARYQEAGGILTSALIAAATGVSRRDSGRRTIVIEESATDTESSVTLAVPNGQNWRRLLGLFLSDCMPDAPDPRAFLPGQLTWEVAGTRLRVVFARARDLPAALRDGWAGYAIFGQDIWLEDPGGVEPLFPIGLDACALVEIARTAPARAGARMRVYASAWPNAARALLAQEDNSDPPVVRPVTGCIEAWLRTGVVDAGVDTYQTGRAVEENSLVVTRRFCTVHAWLHRRTGNTTAVHPLIAAFGRWLHGRALVHP